MMAHHHYQLPALGPERPALHTHTHTHTHTQTEGCLSYHTQTTLEINTVQSYIVSIIPCYHMRVIIQIHRSGGWKEGDEQQLSSNVRPTYVHTLAKFEPNKLSILATILRLPLSNIPAFVQIRLCALST